jgi:hypothetical protein
MADTTTKARDGFDGHDRIYLENLRLAAEVILREGEDPGGLPNTLESELFIFRDRVEHSLLLTAAESKGK